MKNMIIFCTFLSFISCASTGSNINNSVQSGWIDEDTYMVNVTGTDEETAIAQAKHQILKDIVEVRMRNNSRYTDIEKIREEFIIPLQNGIIIKKFVIPEGLQIYYQIHDKGLKLKFQRI
ncbi:MAG TPA: hypothetical protein PKI31_03235 [Spirochaetota bacterium]|mgnify:CR=1 FL=1|nr:hypothetical protein [Spirochaetota bacterium]